MGGPKLKWDNFTRSSLKHPCKKDCPDRKPGCGAECAKWKEYVEKRNAMYAERLAEAEGNRLSPGRVAMMRGRSGDLDKHKK